MSDTKPKTAFDAVVRMQADPDLPPEVAHMIEAQCMQIMTCHLTRLQLLHQLGQTVPRDEEQMPSAESVFTGALAAIPKELLDVDRLMDATMRSCSEDVAIAIDKAMRRLLLDDKHADRDSYLQILGAHASMARQFCHLRLSDEEETKHAAALETE